MTYQLIPLDCEATDPVACPHCQQQVIDWSQEQYVQPCEHTLFIAMDIGFEYITDEFEANKKILNASKKYMFQFILCSTSSKL